MSNLKIMLMGYGRHGKDTVADIFRDKYGLRVVSSSLFVAEQAVFPKLAPLYGYKTVLECYNDRHNHRQEWYEAIKEYGKADPAKMSRELFKTNDVYVGIRNKAEFHAAKNEGLFQVAIWVDATDRLPPEDKSSMTVEPWFADYVIDNNGGIVQLSTNVIQLMDRLMAEFETVAKINAEMEQLGKSLGALL